MRKITTRVVVLVLAIAMVLGAFSMTAAASIPNWEENNVVFDGTSFGTNGYYNVISKKDYVLVPGAAVESEIVLNNADGTRRQVIHVIEVDPSNPDVSIVPGYHQIDKLAEDPKNEANWSHKELTEMAKYYEDNLGYNIVGGMNTDLYYDTYAPRVLVYNGKSIGVKGETSPTSSILYVFKDAEGNISCDVKAFNRADFNKYLEDGILLHAVGVSFGMVVKDGALVSKTEERTSSPAARSMVGVKPDGTLVICMNDGRGANNSVGFCNYEEGEAMLALGCQWAANCDGGGSSTFITKRVGEEDFTMRSVPCDGAQRPTAHGIFVASNVAPTGILDVVNVNAAYDIFAPKTVYNFSAEAIDTHGYAMDMPADAAWALSDNSFGTIENGKFVSNGTKGDVDVQVVSGGKVVGSKTITVADPAVFKLSATSTVVPYTTADKVRTITLPIVAMTGEANVYVDTNAVSVTLSNNAAGILDGFNFTATDDTSIAGVTVTVTYNDIVLNYEIEFGKGSEVIYDFEDGDKAGFMGFEEAKKWSIDNGVNNTLVGAEPLAGQFNEYLSSDTFTTTAEQGGQVRNGNYALAWKLDNSDAAFASWSYNVLFNVGETIVLRDVANGKKATTLGMWIYIPENVFSSGSAGNYSTGKGLAFQSQLYVMNADGTYTCKQDHFMFTSAATGKQTNLNSATNADIPESRWVYATIDISKYDYLCTPVATDISNSRSPSFIRTYIKPDTADEITFYIDDITLDYSSAVDDRVLPTITSPTYSTSDTAVTLNDGTVINGNKIAFSANVADNAALDLTSGKIFVDGIEVRPAVDSRGLSTAADVILVAGTHTVTFEIKDELGNPARLTRTFTVAGDAVVELGGHNDSGKDPAAQSVYYVDINVADLAQVTKLVAQIKLNNANKWETKGAFVADGFEATFAYNEISEILTVTVEMVDAAKAKALSNTLVSIPVRVWTFDRYNYVTNTYYAVADMGNKPVVNVEAEIVYGEITLADKTTSGFSGAIKVATELTTISSPYHVHDEVLTVLNKEATCTEVGYENRTYCETCKSVVDWGTIIDALGHNYVVIDGALVCEKDGVTVNATGLVTVGEKIYCLINGKIVTGWQNVDGDYYYFDTNTYVALENGIYRIDGCNYEFENYILIAGSVVRQPNGLVYMWAGKVKEAGWFTVKDKTYLALPNRVLATGRVKFELSTNLPTNICDFDENGVLIDRNLNGVVEYEGVKYFVKDSVVQKGAQEFEGDIYYFRSNGIAATGKYFVAADKTNGILQSTYYVFGTDGKLIKNGWSTAWDGVERYIVDGKPSSQKGFVTFGGDIYYVLPNGTKAMGRTTVSADALNGIMTEAGDYLFDTDGKLIIEGWSTAWDGVDRYIINGKPQNLYGLVETDGNIYYIRSNNKKATGKYYVPADKLNGLLPEAGYYLFDENGKFIKEGWSNAWDGGVERHIVNGKPDTRLGLVTIGDDIYYIRSNHARATGKYYVPADKLNGVLPEAGYYLFDENGKLIKEGWSTAWDGGVERHIVNGKPDVRFGLITVGDDVYYIRSNYARATGKYYVPADKLNGLLPEAGYYLFDENGKLIKEGWSTAWDGGVERHIVNGKPDNRLGLITVGDDVYYIRSNHARATGKYYVPEDKLNGILKFAGYYTFDENGKLIG